MVIKKILKIINPYDTIIRNKKLKIINPYDKPYIIYDKK